MVAVTEGGARGSVVDGRNLKTHCSGRSETGGPGGPGGPGRPGPGGPGPEDGTAYVLLTFSDVT